MKVGPRLRLQHRSQRMSVMQIDGLRTDPASVRLAGTATHTAVMSAAGIGVIDEARIADKHDGPRFDMLVTIRFDRQ